MSELPRTPLLDVPPERSTCVALLRDVPAGRIADPRNVPERAGRIDLRRVVVRFRPNGRVRLAVQVVRHPHAFNQGERTTRDAVLAKALSFNCPLVEITGGEPLLPSPTCSRMMDLCDGAGKNRAARNERRARCRAGVDRPRSRHHGPEVS